MSAKQQSNAITDFRSSVKTVADTVPVGLATIQRLIDLGVVTVDAQGVFSAGAVESGALDGDNDHLTLAEIASAAQNLMALSASIDANDGAIRRSLAFIPR